MRGSFGRLGVFASVVGLLALACAIALRRLTRLACLMIAIFTFVGAWLITATLDAVRAPDWTMFTGASAIMVSIVAAVVTLHRWTQAGEAGETQPEQRDDDAGGGPRRRWPDTPQPGGGGSDPNWWPGFERRFAVYVAEREIETRPPTAHRPPSSSV